MHSPSGPQALQCDLAQPSLGWLQTAEAVANRARERVRAYQSFLRNRSIPDGTHFAGLPITDKVGYLIPSPYADLLADDCQEAFTIFRSSGASGRAFYWPQLRVDHRWSTRRLRGFLESTFSIDRRRTVAVVALALGSWVGGDFYSWSLKNVALEAPYPFTVFAPGNRYEEVIELLCQPESHVDQFLIVVCPSFIGSLLLQADSIGRPLPLDRMRFLVMGEAFPESLRASLCRRAGLGCSDPFMISVYGSADTGTLGVESPASVALRRLLADRPDLLRELGLGPVVPHFFHFTATDAYVEAIKGELCVTRWQGIPLVRYNLHDSAVLLAWEPLRQAVVASGSWERRHAELLHQLNEAQALPDILAISGRADSCIVLGGTKLTEAMLDEAVRCSELSHLLTGIYRAAVIFELDRPTLVMDLEFRQGIIPDARVLDRVYRELVQALGRVQPEFASDYQNLYRAREADPSQRLLSLRAMAWPTLSSESGRQIKQESLKPASAERELSR